VALVFMLARETWMHARFRRHVRGGGRDRPDAGLLAIGDEATKRGVL
jgi:hypothetical protein